MTSGERHGEVIRVGSVIVWYDERRRIGIIEFEPGSELTIEQTQGVTDALIKVTRGEIRPLIVDFKNMKSQTKESRDYYSKDPRHAATHTATALIVNNAVTRMIANFFLGLNKAVRPVRLFNDRESAIAWIESLPADKSG